MSVPSDEHSALQQQLRERNDLVAALTAQLEKTVNQLDRVRRSGADRPRTGSADPTGPAQPEFVSRLTAVLDEWSEFQPADRIVRIEEGIAQILEKLDTHQFVAAEPTPDELEPAEESNSWEAAKARLLSESPPDGSETSSATAEPQHGESAAASAHVPQPEEAVCPLIPDPPSPVQPDDDVTTLLEAVNSRDTYIQYLTTRVWTIESRRYPPINWAELNNAPDELRSLLEQLSSSLQEQLKQAEIAHSLERAVLTRERARLTQLEQQLDSQLRRLKNGPQPEVDEEQGRKDEQNRRWTRIFSR